MITLLCYNIHQLIFLHFLMFQFKIIVSNLGIEVLFAYTFLFLIKAPKFSTEYGDVRWH